MVPQLQQESPVHDPATEPEWSLATRLGFRFFFCYFILYLGPGAVGALGGKGPMVDTPYRTLSTAIWERVVPWVGNNLLHIPREIREIANGSGDQLFDWVLLLCIAVVALLATVIWSVLDRKRRNYEKLNAWLRLIVRLSLVGPMISYGMAKVIRAQFPEPPLVRLITPLGQQSPEDLLWVFMGSSRLYSFFGGLGETLAGVLLLLPQFTLLGTLIMMGVMTNVLMLNLGYDVSRKILTIHLLLFGLYLLLPDLRRLANFFLFNRPVKPARVVPLFKDKTWNSAVLLLQVAFGIAVIYSALTVSLSNAAETSAQVGQAYRGIWYVEDFVLDGEPHPPLRTDKERWQFLVLDGPTVVRLQMMDASVEQYTLRLNEQGNRLNFADSAMTRWKGEFAIENLRPDEMTLEGKLDNRTLTARLRRMDLADPDRFRLINRKLRWVTHTMNEP